MNGMMEAYGFMQGCCVNAPMITVADYSKGSEGYTYNYYVVFLSSVLFKSWLDFCSQVTGNLEFDTSLSANSRKM